MGLDIYLGKRSTDTLEAEEKLEYEQWQTVEQPSKLHPDHYFKMGYFRSSYNSAGTDQVLENLGLKTFHQVFENVENKYFFAPDWQKALVNAKENLAGLRVAAEHRSFGVTTVDNLFSVAKDDREAMKVFLQVREEHQDGKGMRDFSSRQGTFYLDGFEVMALIPGTQFGRVCQYIIFKKDLSSYVKSLEIVVETIEWVLAQPDADRYYMRWSG